ncbi:MAG: leucyl/phenylalanyl-tRNA--protein transferase, partial [Smithella sp.]
ITDDMIEAYIRLHKAGYAHSVEAWDGAELAGGFYGVVMGKVFFGESMFAKKSDASKVAFATYAVQLAEKGFELIDCQVTTEHMKRFGAREITLAEFIKHLSRCSKITTHAGGKT